jgi:hypothetical protein
LRRGLKGDRRQRFLVDDYPATVSMRLKTR